MPVKNHQEKTTIGEKGKNQLRTPPEVSKEIKISRQQLVDDLRGKDKYLSFFGVVQTPAEDALKIIGAEENLSTEAEGRLDDYHDTDEPSYDMQQNYSYYSNDNVAYVNGKPAEYNRIDGQDSIDVYLANLGNGIGHIIIDCRPANWKETCFVLLNDKGQILMSEKNFNPNPVKEIGEDGDYKTYSNK